MQIVIIVVDTLFLSTLSARRATCIIDIINNIIDNFYPRSPQGERLSCAWSASKLGDFYPRSPQGERQLPTPKPPRVFRFLSTLSARRATHYDNYNLHCTEISIHALRKESDRVPLAESTSESISIHALRKESDPERSE